MDNVVSYQFIQSLDDSPTGDRRSLYHFFNNGKLVAEFVFIGDPSPSKIRGEVNTIAGHLGIQSPRLLVKYVTNDNREG